MTKIRGTIIDAETKEPLPFVNVSILGKNIGSTTDFDGYYELKTQWANSKLLISFVGYKADTFNIKIGKSQVINARLKSKSTNLKAFEITVKKRYRNKGNPAVILIRNVIKHKDDNRKEGQDYFEYDKYEKIEFDLNNIGEDFRNKRAFKKFQFIFTYVDTSELNGKPYLPVYLKETVGKVYYRKNPKTEKEVRRGSKTVGFEDYIDDDGISYLMDKLYQDIDIYDSNIDLLANRFVSPISSIAPNVYKFFIKDTVTVNGIKCIDLAFLPRNKSDLAFVGDLFITSDSSYAVTKVKMGVTNSINLNFVRDLSIEQEFSMVDDNVRMLSKDELIVDYNLSKKGTGIYGSKKTLYKNYKFNIPAENKIYNHVEKIIKEEDLAERSDEFWEQNRLDTLSADEAGIYEMTDSIQQIPAFKRTMDLAMLILAGFKDFGWFSLGPVNTFYSGNSIEGFRARVGGRTNLKFNKKVQLKGYVGYGFRNKKPKYSISARYSFNKDFHRNPKHDITFTYQHETAFPGLKLDFINEDNFLLSFKRGLTNQMVFNTTYKINYVNETLIKGFSYHITASNEQQTPLGILSFNRQLSNDANNIESMKNITTSELGVILRFAPNEQFYQGKSFRIPLFNEYPVFTFRYTEGFKGILNSDFNYRKVSLNIFKRIFLSPIGYSDVELEGGKIFGNGIPYTLMSIPRANQTYAYQLRSYNMMNFLEFVSDEYASINFAHYFQGAIFNKIPLFRRLKFREVITFKSIWGRVSPTNDPAITNGVVKFPVDGNNVQRTHSLSSKPYVEISAGVMNIFKLIRIDLVKRLNYLENPDVPTMLNVKGLGLRVRVKFDF